MSKLSNIIDDATSTYKDYSKDLVQQVQKHYVLSELLGVPISGYSSFTLRNQFYRNRLMNLNIEQHNKILNNFGEGTIPSLGDVSDINYNNDFASVIGGDEIAGNNTTRQRLQGSSNYDNINDLYYNTTNLYYDDNNNGSFSNKLKLTNPNSILNKTKKLFNMYKVNTIISRFHTESSDIDQSIGSAVSVYGMSHGRNLLKKDAEDAKAGVDFYTNGYNNPYCRVWTHHHQYDDISKLIRPFTDENGTPTSIGDLQKDWTFIRGKTGAERLDKYSVLNKNGFVNITPSYDANENLKVDTKHCMFSIENLAWKGYDPYSFEKALSWEQRGPMGGRIMWFPPYGIEFTENVNVNWNSDTLIGRGENIYTYINTERSGNLSFKMLVDHPSIINYYEGNKIVYEQSEESQYAWSKRTGINDSSLYEFYKGKMPELKANGIPGVNTVKSLNDYVSEAAYNAFSTQKSVVDSGQRSGARDTDLLRFFAGCDTIDGVAKNLTDEFKQGESKVEKTTETKKVTPVPKPIVVEEVPEVTGSVVFYVFYPNNYSGSYDTPDSKVEAMAYLLNGAVCQKHGKEDIPISFSTLRNIANGTNGIGTGYEMTTNEGVSDYKSTYDFNEEEMWITGTTAAKKIWKYRIDGGYDEKNDNVRNYYNQQLLLKANYSDKNGSGENNNTLNSNYKAVQSAFNITEIDSLYSFAEIAYVLSDSEEAKNIIEGKLIRALGDSQLVTERLNKLKELFDNFTITKVMFYGHANTHGNNPNNKTNIERNDKLAENRAKSVADWLNKTKYFTTNAVSFIKKDVDVVTGQDVSSIDAKKWRSARVKIEYRMSGTKKLAETNQTNISEDGEILEQGLQEYVGYNTKIDENGKTIYEDANGQIWEKDSDGNLVLSIVLDTIIPASATSRNEEFNNIRYDQEYRFFKVLKEKSPSIFEQLKEKIKYFDPAFHSMTPEGFNGRLNFLHQCTRQGNTIGASDSNNAKTATNLAFGRPPICVLRLGDFYYTEIVITNMTITYDPLQWDLNSEGIGVQPLIANINLTFNFIGGSDLAGPIKRLQNAMSFNYYANTEVYDNRADRVTYPESKNHVYNDSSTGMDNAVYDAYNTKMSN